MRVCSLGPLAQEEREEVAVIARALSTRRCARGIDNDPVKWQLSAFYLSKRREQDEPLGWA